MKKLISFILILSLVLTLAACGEPDEPHVGDDDPVVPQDEPKTTSEPATTDTPSEPEIPDPEPEETAPPRPRSEWTLYINGEETDVFIVVNEENQRMLPFEEVGQLFGGEIENRSSELQHNITLHLLGKSLGFFSSVDYPNSWLIDGIPHFYFIAFSDYFGIYHRTDVENKIIFLEEEKYPWTLYINDSSTDFEVISNVEEIDWHYMYKDILTDDFILSENDWHMVVSRLEVSVDVLGFIGAELRQVHTFNNPNNHGFFYNDFLVWAIGDDPDNPVRPCFPLGQLNHFVGIGISFEVDFAYHKVNLITT